MDSANFSKSEMKLDPTSFTTKFLLKSLYENDEWFSKKYGNEIIKKITTDNVGIGNGFLSHVLKCTIYFISDAKEYSVVLKVPFKKRTDEFLSAFDDEFFMNAHQCECDFYTDIGPILDIPLPKVYKTVPWIIGKQDGCILMEDLSGKGKVKSIYDNLTKNQIMAVIKILAKIHAKILMADEKLWKERFIQKSLSLLAEPTAKAFKTFCDTNEEFENYYDKYFQLVKNAKFVDYIFCQSYIDLNVKPVLCHGDLWNSNIMWKTNENGKMTDELLAIIDWQILMEGSPMMDLARILATSTSGKFRREVETFIVDYYLDCLSKEMKNNEIPYTIDQLQKCYDYGTIIYGFKFIFTGSLFMEEIAENDPERNIHVAIIMDRCKCLLEDADKLLSQKYEHLYEEFNQ